MKKQIGLFLVIFGISMTYSNLFAQPQVDCTINGSTGWYPISLFKEGTFQGIMMDTAREVANLTGISIQIKNKKPWKRILQELEKGQLDIIAGAYYNNERAQKFAYSRSVTDNNIHIFTKRGNEFSFKELSDLKGKAGLRPAGGSYGEIFDRYEKQHLSIIQPKTGKHIFQMLIKGRADYGVLAKKDGEYLMQKKEFKRKIRMLPIPAVKNEVYFLFSRKTPCYKLLNKFNWGISTLRKNGTLDKIIEKYP